MNAANNATERRLGGTERNSKWPVINPLTTSSRRGHVNHVINCTSSNVTSSTAAEQHHIVICSSSNVTPTAVAASHHQLQ
jgi:hypothetical protein